MGVSDQFVAIGNDMLRVDGSGTNQLIITAIGPQRLFTMQSVFVDFLRSVMYVTNDQTGSSKHSISLVVQEFPLDSSPPSLPGLIRVIVHPVNDIPVLVSTQRSQHNLTDYLPLSNNEGFPPSFLIDSSNVVDIDSVSLPFVGLAITAFTDNGRGSWMVWDNGMWVPLSPVSDCSPRLVSPDERIRFVPSPDHSKTDSQASLVYRAWDGTSLIDCDEGGSPVFSNESAVSAESETFTYNIEYLNRAPVITLDQHSLPSTLEDSQSPAVGVGNITEIVASDSDDLQLGLAITGTDSTNGVWEYQSMGIWVEFPKWMSPQSLLLLAYDRQIRFVPNSDFFGTASFDALAWDTSDNITNAGLSNPYTGTFSTNTTTVFIEVESVNDMPVVVVDVPVVEYTEGGPSIQIFRNLSISDIDNEELVWTEVVLDCPMCLYSEGSGSLGSGIDLSSSSTDKILTRHAPPNFLPTLEYSDSMRIVLRIESVEGTNSSPEEFVMYLESLHFASTSREPSDTPRTVTLRVSDGLSTSDMVSVTISIVLVNDEPPMLTFPYPSITWTEDSGDQQLFTSPVTITDLDGGYPLLEHATLELRNYDPNFESLSFNCSQFGLNCSYDDGVLTMRNRQGAAVYQQAFQEVYYVNSNEEPEEYAREVHISVSDGIFSSPVVQLLVSVELINDQIPVVTIDQNEVLFHEPDTNPITTSIRVAPGLTISDADSGGFPLHSATLMILNPQDGTSEGLRLPSGENSSINTTGQDQHSLTIFHEGSIPITALQDAVREVEYFNLAEQQHQTNRTIQVIVSDALTHDGVQNSDAIEILVIFVLVDDLPEVRLMDNILMYSEAQSPQQLPVAVGANIVDVDSTELARLDISLSADAAIDLSGDRINVNLTGFQGIMLTTFNTSIVLMGEASLSDYTAALRTLTYQHTNPTGDPDSGVRTITATPHSVSGDPGTSDSVMVAFTAVNSAPVVDLNGDMAGLNGNAVFQEERPEPLPLTPNGVDITDVDNANMSHMTIELLNTPDSNLEFISISSIPVEQEEDRFSRIEVRGPLPIVAFEEILSVLTYHNLADEPDTTTRIVTVEVSDGQLSGVAQVEIVIAPQNDPPVVILGTSEVVYVEGGSVRIASGAQVFDPDSSIVGFRVRPEQQFPGDVISGPNLTYVQGSGTYVAVLTPSPPEALAEIIEQVTFTSTVLEPTTNDRVLCISVQDVEMASSSEVCVTVVIQVINDNTPVFEQASYQAQVTENERDAPVTNVRAMDADSANSEVTLEYSIIAGDNCSLESGSGLLGSGEKNSLLPEVGESCRFAIDPLTGEVRTTLTAPDREQRDTYTLTISVSDGELSSEAELVVAITDVNDVAPVFIPETYEVAIPVGAAEGFTVAQLMVVDPDLDSDFSLIFLSMEPSIGTMVFGIDQDIPGRIFLNRPDRDLSPLVNQYTLVYEAIDSGFLSSTNAATVVVNITQNLLPPVFDMGSYEGMVSESEANGATVLTVTATDSDPGYHGDFTFSILDSNVPFSIDPLSGELTVSDANQIDFEAVQEYVFSVVATDTGRPQMSSTVSIRVVVGNENDNPPTLDQNMYVVEVCESAPVGFEFLQLSAQDADEDTLSHSIVEMAGCSGCVAVSPNGILSIAREIDYEAVTMISFSVIITDGLFFTDADVTLNILNNNEAAPEFVFEYVEIEISETEQVGSFIPLPYFPLAHDADGCDVDQCDGTAIISNQTCTGRGLQYAITSGNEAGNFEIDQLLGIVSVARNLDADSDPQQVFNLSLSVSDGMFTDTAYLVIIVSDINDNLPQFENSSYSVTIPEDTPVGTTIITTLATDLDPTDSLSYSLIDENGHFDITENGEVFVVEPLDFENISLYSLIVTVTDRPQTPNTTIIIAPLTVYISDVNDNPPVFLTEDLTLYIVENSPPGIVGSVEAVDVDPVSAILQYSILSDDNGGFAIDSLTGEIQSTQALDREFQDNYDVIVQVMDNGVPLLSATTTVRIIIEDVNEGPPIFSDNTPAGVNVSEGTSIGTVILTLSASDTDENRIGFRILSGDIDTFSLQPLAGDPFEGSGSGFMNERTNHIQSVDLVLIGGLDYEGTRVYSLVVEVFDMPDSEGDASLSSTVEIDILVTDENDNPPLFSEAVYTAEIQEFSATNTFVTQVFAIDSDSGPNAVTLFEFQPENELFAINSETGVVTVNRSESVAINLIGEQFTLTVIASNLEPPHLSSTATIIIQLLDINDNAPIFPSGDIVFNIAEDFTPLGLEESSGNLMMSSSNSGSGMEETSRLVSTVEAVDMDQGSNAELRFSLLSGTGRFFIDPLSGELFVTSILDREEVDSYMFEVRVTDLGSPPLASTASVLVIVTDINDNAPMFQQQSYTGAVAENEPAFIDIVPLSATDADIGENADIVFSVIGGSSFPFTVDQQSGYIQTTQPLDSETQKYHSFQVEARNGQLFSLADVQITVLDVNEFPPTIFPGSLNLSLPENTPTGALVQIFTVSDEDSDIGAESDISLRPSTNLFSLDNNGSLVLAGLIDYEVLQSVSFTVVARNLAPPHFEAVTEVSIAIENENDNPPIVGFDVPSVSYDELIQRSVNLDIGITISDADGRQSTRLIDGIIKFENAPIEPSFAYEPVTSGSLEPDFKCDLEVNKLLKFTPCGIPDITVLSRYTPDGLQLRGGLRAGIEVVGDSIVFDASLQQYALYIGNIGTLDSTGLTISTWIWFEPITSSEPQAILSKFSSSQLLYGVFCYPNGSLVFRFTSGGFAESVVFDGGCSTLEDAWHHLGIVVDNTNTQWSLNIFIDGTAFGSVGIPQPFDSTGGLLLGASREFQNSPTTNFFNGRVHMLLVSRSSSTLNSFNCVIGCGLVLVSQVHSPITYYYDYSQRALTAQGTQPIATYEEFLNSLILVLPFTEPRISQYILSYTVQDEVFNCLPTYIDIIVIPSNDFQPEISLNGTSSRNYSTVFVEESGPISLVNTATFYLRDIDLIEFPYVVTARIVDPLQPFTEEILGVQNIPAGMNVSYTAEHTLTLTGLLPLPMFEAVTRTLKYDNTADEPLGASREIMVTVSDPPQPDILAWSMVKLVFVNDQPELILASSISEYSEGDSAMLLLRSATIEDSDSPVTYSAVVTFTLLDPGMEFLSVSTTDTNISAVYDLSTATLALAGAATQQQYEDTLLRITYEHTGMAAPTLGTRRFTFVVSDGDAESTPVSVSLFFAAVNDAPVISLNGFADSSNFTVNFVEDTNETVSIVSPNALIVDVDNESLSYLNLTLLDPEQSESISLSVPNDINTIVAVPENGYFITLIPTSGTSAPLSDFVSVLRTATYTNVAEEPIPGTHTIEFLVSDGLDISLPAYSEVNIMLVNDRPMLDLDVDSPGTGFAPEPFEERGEPVSITGRSISLIDNDVVNFVEFIEVVIQGAVDGLDERITSSNPSFPLPLPSNGQSVTYFIGQEYFDATDPVTYLTSLQYSNTRLEPTPGDRIITIAVSDGQDFSNTALVSLTVVGVNENSPQFTMNTYSFTTTEAQLPPVQVGSVTAIDIDDEVDGTVSYEIAASVPSEGLFYFTINSTSGLITVLQELDREENEVYELTIRASDGGLPQQTANATVFIAVADINDNAPVFYPSGDNVVIMVPETTPVGQVVETVPLIDPDSGPDIISLQLDNTAAPFQVGIFTHAVTVAGDLDVDSQTPEGCINDGRRYELLLTATDAMPPFHTSTAVLSIHVVDVNDNAPQFVSGSHFTVLEENADLSLFTVTATDLDCATNGEITYSFRNSSTYSLIRINGSTGVVSSLWPLDREEQEMYSFTVVATDSGTPRMSSSADVTLEVLDINDNAPVFGEDLYEFEVREDGVTALSGIQAADADIQENGQVATYTLDSTALPVNPYTGQPIFTINPLTGDITFNSTGLAPMFEFDSSYVLTVFAVDAGSPSLTGSATVAVNVSDVNDNAPVVATTSLQGEVPENTAGYLVANFSATDADSGTNSEVIFTLQDTRDVFSIHPLTGELTTVEPLDFEDECYYSLYVVATDRGQSPLSSVPYFFEVFVQPEEDIPPQFGSSPFIVSVPENSPAGTLVITVAAEDEDLDVCLLDIVSGSGSGTGPEGLTYSFADSSENFIIEEQTGGIHLLQMLDFEDIQQYVLTVLATDVAGLQAEGIVVINVLDRNDVFPRFLQSFYETTVTENTAVGSSILQVTAVDEDSLDQGRLVYSLAASSPYFDIDPSTGTLFLSGAIDFETVGSFVSLSAVVTDSAANSAAVPVNIHIVDTNDLPPVINTQPETFLFIEGQVSLRPFPALDISDPDSFQHLCNASIVLYSPEKTTLSQPDQCSCSDTTSSSTCTPDCLEFLQLSQLSFPGVINLLEEGSRLVLDGNYSIAEYKRALEEVEYVNVIFDPTPQARTVSLTVSDCLLNSNTLVQSVDIQPLNTEAPIIDLNGDAPGINFETTFQERGQPVLIASENVSVSDADMIRAEQVLTGIDIQLTNAQDDQESLYITSFPVGISIFSNSTHLIMSGVTSLEEYTNLLRSVYYRNSAPEPSPQPRLVEFTVHEYSLSSPPAYTEIRIATINDYPPSVIADPPRVNYDTSFAEGLSGVDIVAPTAVIEDSDSTNDNVIEMQVYILRPSPSERLLLTAALPADITLDQSTEYSLFLSGSAPRPAYETVLKSIQYQNTEDEFSYIFPPAVVFIQISDHSLSGFTVTQIDLGPVNDQLPQFTEASISFSVSENTTVGTSVYQVQYTDQDTFSPTEPNFSITGGNTFFSISPDTGVITLAQSLDYEATQQHIFTVELTDLGYVGPSTTPASVEVTVVVTDQNDHAPMFTQELYNGTIDEGAPVGSTVLQLSANDRDSQMHSLLEFAVINTTAFGIDSTGVLFTLVELDQEAVPFYQFVVSVRNPGDVVADTADVFINISDVNDHAPFVSLSPSTATLQEPDTRTALSYSLTITDEDANPSLDYAVVEILGDAPGALVATAILPEISVAGNGSKSLILTGASQSLSSYEYVLRGVEYVDTSEEPLLLVREIGYQVGSDPGPTVTLNYNESETLSNIAVFQVSIQVVNDQVPQILLDTREYPEPVLPGCSSLGSYSTNYTEDSSPVLLSDDSLSIRDNDSGETFLLWATVQLLQPTPGDSLAYSEAIELNTTTSSATYLVIQGPATIAEFEAALHTVAYQTSSQNPQGTKQIQFTVNDGVFVSEPALACVELVQVNDAPVVTLGANGSVDTEVMYREGQTDGLMVAPQLTIRGRCTV